MVRGSASANSLLVAVSSCLFGAEVLTNAAHQEIHADVDLHNKKKERKGETLKCCDKGQKISNHVLTREKVLHSEAIKYG